MTFHHFDTLLPNLRFGNVDDLLDDTLWNTLLWNKPNHMNDFLLNLWHGHVQHAILHPVLWNKLHEVGHVLHHL